MRNNIERPDTDSLKAALTHNRALGQRPIFAGRRHPHARPILANRRSIINISQRYVRASSVRFRFVVRFCYYAFVVGEQNGTTRFFAKRSLPAPRTEQVVEFLRHTTALIGLHYPVSLYVYARVRNNTLYCNVLGAGLRCIVTGLRANRYIVKTSAMRGWGKHRGKYSRVRRVTRTVVLFVFRFRR